MNTRREFFGLLGAGAIASVATVRATAAPACPVHQTHVGLVTVDSHKGRDVHVWLDGEDVTRDCFEADDRAPFGYVKCYKRNSRGNAYIWGMAGDPDPATRRDDNSKLYRKVDGKWAWNKPYPGFGDVAYEEFTGDVRIVVV